MWGAWATIEGLYEFLGKELSAGVRHRMQTYLAARPQSRHGAHRYSFADTGLQLDEERQRYRAYQERYDVASEV